MSDKPPTDVSDARLSGEEPDLTYALDAEDRPSEAVVRAVASLTDTPPLELEPIYQVIDPDHLNGLFDSTRTSSLHQDSSITFHFNGCLVTVTPDSIHIRKQTDDIG